MGKQASGWAGGRASRQAGGWASSLPVCMCACMCACVHVCMCVVSLIEASENLKQLLFRQLSLRKVIILLLAVQVMNHGLYYLIQSN